MGCHTGGKTTAIYLFALHVKSIMKFVHVYKLYYTFHNLLTSLELCLSNFQMFLIMLPHLYQDYCPLITGDKSSKI